MCIRDSAGHAKETAGATVEVESLLLVGDAHVIADVAVDDQLAKLAAVDAWILLQLSLIHI